MPNQTLLSFATLLAVAGCAATAALWGDSRDGPCLTGYIDEQKLAAELSAARPRVRAYSEMTFVLAIVDGSAGYGIAKTSDVFEFPSGKSRFVALELPTERKSQLVVRPTISGRTTTATSCADTKLSVFVGDGSEWYRAIEPTVTFLDQEKRPLATATRANSPETGDYRHPVPASAKYIVVHSLPERIGVQRRIYQVPYDVLLPPTGAVTLRSPSSLAAIITHTGRFTLEFRD